MTAEEIQKLEEFFKNAERPLTPFLLDPATLVIDYDQMLRSHFGPLKKNPDSKVLQPRLWRLKALKLMIESNQK